MAHESYDTFDAVKARLDEIVDAVSDDSLALDDALALYEEAVGLGLRASDLLEDGIEAQQADDEDAELEAASEGSSDTEDADDAAGALSDEESAAPEAGAPVSA